ncbi:MAG TPA: L-threonylcarbamoyladenylate synthase [Candidatus Edwardsbacteria bacterium]|nr:L-threonylcarbamoyladenylate synthase [Candidatus Edwardsbacteria bacterium]
MFARRKGEIVPCDPARPQAAVIAQVTATLGQGGVIAFPTDTVYGLGCRADAARAVRRIYAVKGRASHKPLVLLLRDAAALPEAANNIPQYAQRLIKKFWPGPLTLVLPASPQVARWKLDSRGTVGVRVVPSPLVAAIVAAAGVPLATTSANPSGRRDSLSALDVARTLAKPVDLILDGGPLPPAPPSAVVDCTGGAPVILRKGVLTRSVLQQAAGAPVKLASVDVLFVCTGNTCRSPMAEGWLRQSLPREWRDKVRVHSCGTGALPGMPATDSAVAAARRNGFRIDGHRATLLTDSLLRQADLVVAMEERHRQAIRGLAPAAAPVLLCPDGVPDPIGQGDGEYQRTLELIKREMPDIVTLIREMIA